MTLNNKLLRLKSFIDFIIIIALFIIIFIRGNLFAQNIISNSDINFTKLLALCDINSPNDNSGSISNPGTITGLSAVCPNSTGITYSVALVPGATLYNWTVPSGATITTGQGSAAISVNFGTLTGNICVTAENACAASMPDCLAISVSSCSFICNGILTDNRDNNTYSTVRIGSQCWMAQNLNYGSYIPIAASQSLGYKFCQNLNGNDDPACPMGGLYQWATLMNGAASCNGTCTNVSYCTATGDMQACAMPVQGLCPDGWHVPSHFEWVQLVRNVGTPSPEPNLFPYNTGAVGNLPTSGEANEGASLKSAGSWVSNCCDAACDGGGTCNSSGFNALPGGYSQPGWASLYSAGSLCWFGTSTNGNWLKRLDNTRATIDFTNNDNRLGASVRCLKN